MGWGEMGQDDMEQDRMGWDGMGRDGMGWEGTGQDQIKPDGINHIRTPAVCSLVQKHSLESSSEENITLNYRWTFEQKQSLNRDDRCPLEPNTD